MIRIFSFKNRKERKTNLRFPLSLKTGGAFLSVLILIFVSFPNSSFAAFTQQINYQGKLTNTSGAAVPDGSYNFRFKIYTSSSGGIPVWTETHSGDDRVTVTNGLFTVSLGSLTSLSDLNFDSTFYLSVEVGGSAASPTWDGEMSPRRTLGAVPAAFQAKEANNASTLGNLSASSFLRSDAATTLSASSVSSLLTINQTGSGPLLDLKSSGTSVFGISNLGVITSGTWQGTSIADAYIDDNITASNYVPLSQKGVANGVATLNALGKVPTSQLTPFVLTETFVVSSEAAMLALSTAEIGDVAVRTDLNKTYILKDAPASNVDNWVEMLTPTDNVLSVNGQTGSVYLDTDDVAEGSTNLYFTNSRVDDRIALQKGVANGVASLGSDGKIPTSQIGSLFINDVYVVANNAAMLALSATKGDIAVVTGDSKTYVLKDTDPTVLANWVEITSAAGVLSVNGESGSVTLTTSDIAEGSNLYFTNARARGAISVASDPLSYNSGTGVISISHASSTADGYLLASDWITFNNKQNAVTGGASSILTSNLDPSLVLVSSAGGKVAVSAVTATELGYLSGVTSAIQTQLGARVQGAGSGSANGLAYWSDASTIGYTFAPSLSSLTATDTAATTTLAGGLRVAGVSGFSVLQNGNVGVGTAAPSYKLDISGTANISDNLYVAGNLGVGTTSPYAKLSVAGTIVGARFVGTTTATSTLAGGLNITGGCFSINDVCIGGSGGTGSGTVSGGTTGALAYYTGVNTVSSAGVNLQWDSVNKILGLATTSQSGTLFSTYINGGNPSNPFGNSLPLNIGATSTYISSGNASWLGLGGAGKDVYISVGGESGCFMNCQDGAAGGNIYMANGGMSGDGANYGGAAGNITMAAGGYSGNLSTSGNDGIVSIGNSSTIGKRNATLNIYGSATTTGNFTLLGRLNPGTTTTASATPTYISMGANGASSGSGQPGGPGAAVYIAGGGNGYDDGDIQNGGNAGRITLVAGGNPDGGSYGNDGIVDIGNNAASAKRAALLNLYGNQYVSGKIGIGTTTPGSILSLGNTGADTINISNTATSTFGKGINIASGCFAINGTCISGGAGGGSGTINAGATGQLTYYATDGTAVSGSSNLYIIGGNLGVGTSTPYAKLSVVGEVVGAYFTGTTTATSTFGQLRVTAAATSTFAGGINVSGGCFAINGVCLPTSAGAGSGTINSGSSGQLTYYSADGTTVSGSSDLYLSGGKLGIGTTTPGTILSLGNTGANTINLSTSATSTFGMGINIASGCFAINGTCISGGSGSGTVNSGTTGQVPYYAGNGTALTATSTLFISTAGRVGVGIATPASALHVQNPSGSTGELILTNASSKGAFPTNVLTGTANSLKFSVGNDNTGSYFFADMILPSGAAYRHTLVNSTGYTGSNPAASENGNTFLQVLKSADSDGSGWAALESVYHSGLMLATYPSRPIVFAPNRNEALRITGGGNIGIGTTTPGSILSLGNTGANTINISTTATSTFGKGINIASGCFAINGTCVGSGGSGSGTVNSGTTGQLAYYAADGTGVAGTSTLFISTAGNVGVGTSTPTKLLTVYSPKNYDSNILFQNQIDTVSLGGGGSTNTATTAPQTMTGWTNSNNIAADDDAYATTLVSYDTSSSVLYAKNFGFAIPTDATIDGVAVTIRKKAFNTNGVFKDYFVNLTTNGTNAVGNNKASTAFWTTTETASYYGGVADKWGVTLTPAIVNSSNFGIYFSIYNYDIDYDYSALVDSIEVKVYYTTSAGTYATENWIMGIDASDSKSFKIDYGSTLGTTNSLVIASSTGNVGIGTSSPYAKLSVSGNVVASNFVGTTTATSTLAGGLDLAGTYGLIVNGGSANSGKKSYYNQSGTEGLTINTYYDSADSNYGVVDLVASRYSNGSSGGSQMRFFTQARDTNTPVQRMVIDKDGKVGVGTTSPNQMFSVGGSSYLGGSVGINANPFSNTLITMSGNISGGSDNAYGTYMGGLTLTPATGWNAYFQHIGGGTVAAGTGVTIPRVAGLYVDALNKSGSGTITNSYGIYVAPSTIATNNYGAYIGGNVGIGTTSPAAPVHIEGAGSTNANTPGLVISRTDTGNKTRLQQYYTGQSYYAQNLYRDSVSGLWYLDDPSVAGTAMIQAAGAFTYYSNAATAGSVTPNAIMKLDSTGNLGIGTTSPWAQLSINPNGVSGPFLAVGSTTATVFLIDQSGATTGRVIVNGTSGDLTSALNTTFNIFGRTNGEANMSFIRNDATTVAGENLGSLLFDTIDSGSTVSASAIIQAVASEAHTTTNKGTYLSFSVKTNGTGRGNNPTEVMRMDATGNIGIGTTSPYAKLSVVGTVVASNFVGTTTSTSTLAGGLSVYGATGLTVLSNNGYVGVGTAAPETLFHVSGGDFTLDNARYLRWKDSGGSRRAMFNLDSSNNFNISNSYVGSGDIILKTGAAGLERLRITSSTGFVGVGTSSPSSHLHVFGSNASAYIDSAVDTNSNLQFKEANVQKWHLYNDNTTDRLYVSDAGDDTGVYLAQDGTSWTANSDIRLKENIVPIEGALNKVLGLTGYTYNFKGSNKKEIGLIAQEVHTELPELVNADSEYWGLTYDRLGPVLLQAIKEQQGLIVSLQARLDTSVYDGALSSSTPWHLNEETGQIEFFSSLDLKGQALSNIRSLASQSGTWSLSEEGKLVIKGLEVSDYLKVGSPEKRIGITLYDEVTGAPYCLIMSNGAMKTTAGECGQATTSPSLPNVTGGAGTDTNNQTSTTSQTTDTEEENNSTGEPSTSEESTNSESGNNQTEEKPNLDTQAPPASNSEVTTEPSSSSNPQPDTSAGEGNGETPPAPSSGASSES